MNKLIITTKKQNYFLTLLISIIGICIPLTILHFFPTIDFNFSPSQNNPQAYYIHIFLMVFFATQALKRAFVQIKKQNYFRAISTTIITGILLTILYLIPHNLFVFYYARLVFLFIKLFLYGCTILFCILFSLILSRFFSPNKPDAILDKNGIWTKHFNFIPWTDIATLNSYQQENMTTAFRINVKNKWKLFKQANLEGKIHLIIKKIMHGYDVSFSNIDLSPDEIINFYHLYGQEKQ